MRRFRIIETAKDNPLGSWIKQLITDEDGASLTEYGLLIALIAAVCIAAVTLLGANLAAIFNNMASAV